MRKKHERNSQTYFEQIPLDVVKAAIAKADVSKDDKAGADVINEPVSGKSEPNRVPARSRDRKRR
jgi:hypothetical protein